jgi:hypothetical protein
MIGALLCNAGPVAVQLSKGYSTMLDLDDLHLIGTGPWYSRTNTTGKVYAAQSKRGTPQIQMHRLIIGTGWHDFAGGSDHINGDSLDNRRENLRAATPHQNNVNIEKGKLNKLGFRGVHRSAKAAEKQFYARVGVNGEYFYSGHYETPEEAARAYDRLAAEHHGEFAVLNFPEERS